MSAQIIDGKKIALELRAKIAEEIVELKKKHHLTPTLAVILVGNDPASEVYVHNKEKAAHGVGMNSILYCLDAQISGSELRDKIKELNEDKKVHGILLQLPLPKHLNASEIIPLIDPKKDVDGFHVINAGLLAVGDLENAIVPCTPLGCVHLIKSVIGDDLAGVKALVIGTSNIVGRPLAQLLIHERATVTIANRSTRDLKVEALAADLIISATGVANLIKADMVKKGAVVIDVGINRITDADGKTKLVGDVDFEGVKKIASAITPVPGGVGPMTIAYLLQNTVNCFLKQIA